MANIAFPNYMDLNQISQQNPWVGGMAFDQFQNQSNLANMFAEQGLQQGQQDIRTKELANVFSEQANPLKVEGLRLGNEQTALGNRKTGVETRIAEGTEEQAMKTKLRELLSGASKADLAAFEQDLQRRAYSDDPKEREEASDLMRYNREWQREREKETLDRYGRERQILLQGQVQAGLEQQRIDAGKYNRGKAAQGLVTELAGARTHVHKANIYEAYAYQARANGDHESADKLEKLAVNARQDDVIARAAGAATLRPGQADIDKLGIPATPAQIPQPRPAPAAATPPVNRNAELRKKYGLD